jgi:hypothetical protein
MVALGILLFAAPFVPPFRPVAVDMLLILIILGNAFILFVITATISIYYRSKLEEGDEDPEEEEAVVDYEAKLMARKDKSE